MAKNRYQIEVKPSASKALSELPREAQERIRARIDGLADDPRPYGVKRLKGPEGFLRLRVGDYRVIYTVRDDVLLVLVVRIAHRREVYR